MATTPLNASTTLNDGHQMPLLGLGTSLKITSQKDGSVKKTCEGPSVTTLAVEAALTAGYRHIDTAFAYRNEEDVREGINAWVAKTGGKRSDLFITTKLPTIAMHPDRVERFLRMSLKNLGLEYVDLYLIHLPIGLKYNGDLNLKPKSADGKWMLDYGSDIIAIWREMVAMQQKGLVKSIGVSNFGVKHLRKLMAQPLTPPAVNQVELHAEFQQPALRRYCTEEGIALTGYGNLGSPGRGGTEIPNLLDNPIIRLVANNHQVDTAHVLLKYWIQQGIAVLPKSITPSRILNNSKVFEWSLTPLEMKAVASLDRGKEGRSFHYYKSDEWTKHADCPAPTDD